MLELEIRKNVMLRVVAKMTCLLEKTKRGGNTELYFVFLLHIWAELWHWSIKEKG